MGNWWRQVRRTWVMLVAVVPLSLVLASCAGPAPLNQAMSVDGHIFTLDQYRVLTRLTQAIDGLQNATPGWQLPEGRQELVKAQKNALYTLLTTELFKEQAQTMYSNKVITQSPKALDDQVTTQTNTNYRQLAPQYQSMVDRGILSPASYRYLVEQQVYGSAVLIAVAVPIAHVHVLTVADQATAQKLQAQLQGGADWATIAKASSIDGAKDQGGDIPQLPQGVLDPQLDKTIFDGKTPPDPKTIQIVQVAHGWALVQVLDRKSTLLKDLDTTNTVITGSPVVQEAAVNHYINALIDRAKITLWVDWCNSTTGAACAIPRT